VAGSLIGANASSKAAAQQAQQQQNALNWVQNVYQNSANNFQPYIGAGQQALQSILGFYGLPGGNAGGATQAFNQFTNTPFYQFPLQQANLATNRALAASGLIGSGGALRDISQLNSGYASQGFGNYLSGLTGIAGSGQQATAQLGGIGVQTGPQVSQALTGIGNAQAAGTIGSTNALTGGIGGAIGSLTNPNAISGFQNAFNNLGVGQSSYGLNSTSSGYDPSQYGYTAGSPSTFGLSSLNG
jgi:hypothetical protein